MKATFLNCTLKKSPERSNTEALARIVIEALEAEDVDVELIRVVDHRIPFGVKTEMGDDDQWPRIHARIIESEILVIAAPTWLGQPSSVAKLALERMDAMIGETDEEGRPLAYNKVAGVVNTGNEDGAHHVIMEINGALGDIGFTIPPQSFTYWNKGPGPGDQYLDTDEGHEWAASTGRAMAANLLGTARALKANPLSAPPG